MYFADTPTKRIDVFDYDIAAGTPSNRRVFVELSADSGYPDGSTVDSEGCLWNAEWGGSRIVRYTPKGKIDRVIALPAPLITCCAFGGPDLSTLFVTSARTGLDEKAIATAPLSGALFAINVGIQGLKDAPFGSF
jgi:sugar lactone lactonase YvrE